MPSHAVKSEKSTSWWARRRNAKEEERKEKEKARKLAEFELREQAVAELKSIGADASHLEVAFLPLISVVTAVSMHRLTFLSRSSKFL